jgi:Tol biopolymer transport system component
MRGFVFSTVLLLVGCGGAASIDGNQTQHTTPKATPSSVQLIVPTQAHVVGGTISLAASVKDAAGNTLSNEPVVWTSTNATIATIDATGLVRELAAGTTTITASVQSAPTVSASLVLTVTVPTVAFTGTIYVSVQRAPVPGGPLSFDIVAVNPTTGAETDLTRLSTGSETFPSVSPDGTYLFYYSGNGGAVLIKSDGTSAQAITGSPNRWLSDGRLLVIAQGGQSYYTINPATQTTQPFPVASGFPLAGSVSPTGDMGAYASGGNIYVVSVGTGAARLILPACLFPTTCGSYVWSPDAKSIFAPRDGAIVQAPVDGSARTTVYTATAGALSNLAVSPDGAYVSFVENQVLKLLRLDGHSTPTVLSTIADFGDAVAWSPDSKSIVYGSTNFNGAADFANELTVSNITGASAHVVAVMQGNGTLMGFAWSK